MRSGLGQGIGIQIGLHSRDCGLASGESGNRSEESSRQSETKPFIGKEEERLVLDDRAADHASEIILFLNGFRNATVAGEPVVGVQNPIAEVIEERSVKLIGPRASLNGDLSAEKAAEFRSVGGSLDAELPHGIHGDQALRGAKGGQPWQITARLRTQRSSGGHAEVGADSIHHEHIGVCALAIDAELSAYIR